MTVRKMGNINSEMQSDLSVELQSIIKQHLHVYPQMYRTMIEYQLGMDRQGNNDKAHGKRLRPLFVLQVCQALGGKWQDALAAAASVELLHNFSLIHDDIQDGSETRRGRDTVWKKWGIAQAINIGDAMLTLSFLALGRLESKKDHKSINSMKMLLEHTCLTLTKGQFLDLAYEQENNIPMELYWEMVYGKTAVLLSSSCKLGAMVGGAEPSQVDKIGQFGITLGLAFQVQDDYLGIWGDPKITGKSQFTDLLCKKKTYPILKGLEGIKSFSDLWNQPDLIDEKKATELARVLDDEGIKAHVKQTFSNLYINAFQELDSLNLDQLSAAPLYNLVETIIQRVL
jgi:geranylgeranyl diphosphate synthase type I